METKATPPVSPAADQIDKYSPAGRLLRYCRGRLNILPIRLVYELVGSSLVVLLSSPVHGIWSLVFCVLGEVVETVIVIWAMSPSGIERDVRLARLNARDYNRAEKLVTFGSVAWAIGMSIGVIFLWNAGGAALWFTALTFLLAASVNAHLVGALHPRSLWAKQAILLLAGVFLFLTEAGELGGFSAELSIFAVCTVIMSVTLSGLFFRLNLQNARRHKAEQKLRASKQELVQQVAEVSRLAEEASAANLAKSEFLAAMSHEIRTPMNGVLGMAELLGESKLNKDQRELVETISRSGKSLLAIINNILDLSKIEAGKLVLSEAPFSPTAMIRDAAALVRPLAKAKGLAFRLNTQVATSLRLMGDEGRLRQVLVNLLGNAVKFTETGSVALSGMLQNGPSGAILEVSVSDTGPGIAREDQLRVFNAFEQVDGKLTRAHGGTGLGLAISRQIVEKMGGTLELVSASGTGSCFTLRVRLKVVEAAKVSKVNAGDPLIAGQGALRGRTVLLAEDNRTNRILVERFLASTGATIIAAHDGCEAVKAFARIPPDLVLMDVSMPCKSGLEATRDIRRAEIAAGLGPVPILALTANAFAEDRARCIEAGMDDFLTKPIRKAALLAAIGSAMAGATGARATPAAEQDGIAPALDRA